MDKAPYGEGSGGLRISELCNLKVSDIYASSMRILIRKGKGGKDRFTILSKSNLDILSKYWRTYKPSHPDNYLFLSRLGNPMNPRTVHKLFHKYLDKAGIRKNATVHTLRHDFATHSLTGRHRYQSHQASIRTYKYSKHHFLLTSS